MHALEQLSPLDAAFLRLETPGSPMHLAWVGLCRPHPTRPRPTVEALRASISSRLRHLPRCRHRLATPPAGLGDPWWVDDADFDIARHVVAFTEPDEAVTLASFDDLVDALLAEPLERDRPLWHFTLVPRLEDGRIGFACRVHHAMADGLGGLELAAILFADVGADDEAAEGWVPSPAPGDAELAARSVGSQLDTARRWATGAARAALSPRSTVAAASERLAGLAGVAREGLVSPAPRSWLDVPTGSDRRLARLHVPVDDVLSIKRAAGVTFNDVCLATVAGALRELALKRWESPLPLRAMVPVNRRSEEEGGVVNRIAFSFAELPVDAPTPEERLRLVHERTQRLKRSNRADAAEAAMAASALLPAPLKGPLARFAAAGRLFNLPVSTIPGPREPLTLLGATIEEGYPVGPLAAGHALFVAVLSYDDGVFFGLHADPEALPEIDALPGLIRAELDALARVFPPQPTAGITSPAMSSS